jgi:hypothetical protein
MTATARPESSVVPHIHTPHSVKNIDNFGVYVFAKFISNHPIGDVYDRLNPTSSVLVMHLLR